MSMSSAVGEIIALGLTPLMVPTPDYIALMNIVWFIPAALGFVLCIYKVTYQGKNYRGVNQYGRLLNLVHYQRYLNLFKVKADHPPTPPSASAALEIQSSNDRRKASSNIQRWLRSIKELARNKYFVLMFFVVGCFLGYNSAVITKVTLLDIRYGGVYIQRTTSFP